MHLQQKTCGCSCNRPHPIEDLSAEHRTILGVIGSMSRELAELRSGAPMQQAFWSDVLEFIENYADRCHHGKEENLLFAELERANPGGFGPTACLRGEHDDGRRCRQAMATALASGDAPAMIAAASAWTALLEQHIAKEDQVLFPMAKRMLDHAAIQRLRNGFAAVEHDLMGEGTHCRFEALGERLAAHGLSTKS